MAVAKKRLQLFTTNGRCDDSFIFGDLLVGANIRRVPSLLCTGAVVRDATDSYAVSLAIHTEIRAI